MPDFPVIIGAEIYRKKGGTVMEDATRKFTALDSKAEMREILSSVYTSLMVKGYKPIN